MDARGSINSTYESKEDLGAVADGLEAGDGPSADTFREFFEPRGLPGFLFGCAAGGGTSVPPGCDWFPIVGLGRGGCEGVTPADELRDMASADPLVSDVFLGLGCDRTTTDGSPIVSIIWILLGCWYLGREVSGGLLTGGRAEDWVGGEYAKSMI